MAHTRYTTKGRHDSVAQTQPLVNAARTIALVHNGQVRCDETQYCTDSSYVLDVLETCFRETEDVPRAFQRLFATLDGAYACAALVKGRGFFAFRDPRGVRPLCYAATAAGDVVVASESCAFAHLALATNVADLGAGQYVHVAEDGALTVSAPASATVRPCLFEFVYLAHDDSTIDGVSVRAARERMGELLAPLVAHIGAEVVVPVPHTPVVAGKVLARILGLEYVELLQVRSARHDEYGASRTFILPTQSAREHAVRQKFAVRASEAPKCRGKNVLILDDSIVRGTTLRHVAALVRREAAPTTLYAASLSPPIVAPNVYGIAIPDTSKLVAQVSEDATPATIGFAVARCLGVDGRVVYQTLERLERGLAALCHDGRVAGFEHSAFYSR